MRLLLLSSSRAGEGGYLEYAKEALEAFLGAKRRLLFVPYARVLGGYDAYLAQVRPVFAALGCSVESAHEVADPVSAVSQAEVIAVGGGNTWHLARELHRLGLVEPIQRQVRAGTPYIGWSAGSNVACPTFQTTNDMPICDPLGFDGLGLVPFQINPHYLHGSPPGFHGETREARILEYLELHPGVWVVGLREGSMLQVHEHSVRLLGSQPCRLFRRGDEPRELQPHESFDFLFQ